MKSYSRFKVTTDVTTAREPVLTSECALKSTAPCRDFYPHVLVPHVLLPSGYTAHAVIDAVVKAARGIGKEGKKRRKQLAAAAAAGEDASQRGVPQPPALEESKKKKQQAGGGGGGDANTTLGRSVAASDSGAAADAVAEDGEGWVGEAEGLEAVGLLDDSLELVLPLIDNELFGERDIKAMREVK